MKTTCLPPNFSYKTVPALPGLAFGRGLYTHHHFQPHFHEHYVIQLVDKGICEGHCLRKSFQVTSNEILLINPGEVHTGSSYERAMLSYRSLCPTPDFVRNMLAALEFNPDLEPHFTSFSFTDKDIVLKIKNLFVCFENGEPPLALEAAALSLFSGLLQRHANSTFKSPGPSLAANAGQKAVQRAKNYLCGNFAESFTLLELSRHAGISPAYLSRLFRAETGLSPWQYLLNYRIERAKTLLINKSTVTETAYNTGFFDPSHFSRHFRRITGVAPGDFKI